jgi:hypothetical protein
MQDQKRGLKKLLPADGIIVARSPYGGIGTLRFKSNWRERYPRNIGPPILWNTSGFRTRGLGNLTVMPVSSLRQHGCASS